MNASVRQIESRVAASAPRLRCSAAALGLLLAVSAVWGADSAAEDVLRGKGLQRIGRFWCLREEMELRDRLATLEHLDKAFREARQQVEQIIDQNESHRARLAQLDETQKRIRALVDNAKPGTAERKKLDTELHSQFTLANQVRDLYVDPIKLASTAPLKPHTIDLVNARTELVLNLLAIRGLSGGLAEHYDRLRQDTEIAAALTALAAPDQLGPSKSYKDVPKMIERIEQAAFGDSLPLYRDGGFYRVTAIINEQQPITFSYGGTSDPTIIPDSFAAAAGLPIDKPLRQAVYHFATDRDIPVRVVQIAQLRLGRHVLRDVEAYILPPEAAELGARLGQRSLGSLHVSLDPNRLQLTVK